MRGWSWISACKSLKCEMCTIFAEGKGKEIRKGRKQVCFDRKQRGYVVIFTGT